MFTGGDQMLSNIYRHLAPFYRDQQGSNVVEFAIFLPIFLILVFGIIDFGHAWYMKQVMVNASREGARYGTRFKTDSLGNRLLPSTLTPSIVDFVKQTSDENGGKGGVGLVGSLGSDTDPHVSVGGQAATESNSSILAGEDLTVTITATKTWMVISKLIPGLGSQVNLSVTTNMLCE
jgi:Flp pilus assembly protein TadG